MTVFFDVDTQIDFLYPAGALYVPGAETIVPALAKLNRYAEENGITVVSTTDAHTENDPEFEHWPPHCVTGTVGQLKPQSLLLSRRSVVPVQKVHVLPKEPQILVEKVKFDAFSNPNLSTLLDELGEERFVVYGVVTEICVKHAVEGLLKRPGARVELVTDAVRSLCQADSDKMLQDFTAAGGVLTTVAEVCR